MPNFLDLPPTQVLEKWLEVLPRNITNLQTQMITNQTPNIATAENAFLNLKSNYKFFATIENLDFLISKLALFFSNPKIEPIFLNQGTSQSKMLFEDLEFIEMIEYLNQEDIKLYKSILAFEEKLVEDISDN